MSGTRPPPGIGVAVAVSILSFGALLVTHGRAMATDEECQIAWSACFSNPSQHLVNQCTAVMNGSPPMWPGGPPNSGVYYNCLGTRCMTYCMAFGCTFTPPETTSTNCETQGAIGTGTNPNGEVTAVCADNYYASCNSSGGRCMDKQLYPQPSNATDPAWVISLMHWTCACQ